MGTLLLVLLLFFGLFVALFFKIFLQNNFVSSLFAYTLIITFSGFVTSSPDWEAYDAWVKLKLGKDVFFNLLVELLNASKYQDVHIVYIGLSAFFLVFFISRFSGKVFLISILYLPIVYLYFTTQVRFFLGYFSMALAFYYWFVTRKVLLSFFLFVFAIMNHISLIIFIPLVYFFYVDIEKVFFRSILASGLSLAFYRYGLFVLSRMFPNETRMLSYATTTNITSFQGAIFYLFPFIIIYGVVFLYFGKSMKRLKGGLGKIQFLYRFSLVSLLFLGVATELQVVGQRFIIPGVIFPILLVFSSSRYNSKVRNIIIYQVGSFLYLSLIFYRHILPRYLFDSNYLNERIAALLDSNTLLNFFW